MQMRFRYDFVLPRVNPITLAPLISTILFFLAQSYRGAVLSFSQIAPRSWRMFILDAYWIVVLIGGTVSTIWICGKFLYLLPEWTAPDVSDEEEPPAPYETLLSQQQMVTAGDSLTQNFVSPAILQANETGVLILSRSARDGTLRYVRTRRIRALGFEPTMNWSEIQEEREKLVTAVGETTATRTIGQGGRVCEHDRRLVPKR